ncbi:MAG TPA: histidine phosphatase family protein [Bacteroidales bacterium]|nr:histidine phosphatase family protein [Bacteroidales bacterium]
MKTIYLVRHAHATRSVANQPDIKRPLAKTGIERSLKIGNILSDRGVKPALIISSNAVRAKDTARILARSIGYPENNILLNSKIYLSSENDLLDIISSLSDKLASVMLVGHNPSMTGFAMMLQAEIQEELPTSSVVCISADTDSWHTLLNSKIRVNFIIASSNGNF